MLFLREKIARDKRTVKVMIGIFCRQKHLSKDALCLSCRDLLDYAHWRLERCPFGKNKRACADCAVHCYEPKRRQEIIDVMHFSGPRMTLRHPMLAVFHMMEKIK
jgi:hypothetical protein